MTIRYHLVKDMPASGNWEDESKWTMLTDTNGVRTGHITLPLEELKARLEQAHGKPTLALGDGKLSLCGLWPGRDLTYSVTFTEAK